MCYNPEVSLATFIFGCISAIILYKLNLVKNTIIIILLSFTFIQFIEFITWTYYNNSIVNYYTSILAFITIIIQMILLQVFLLKPKLKFLSLISFVFFILLFIFIQLPKVNFSMSRGKNKHLIWHWLDLPIIWIIIGLFYYLLPTYYNKFSNIYIFIFTLVTVIISLYFYYNYKTWGSMWCYISNIGWFLLIIYSLKLF